MHGILNGIELHSQALDAFYLEKDDGVFYISHASILVRLSGKLFLFDPVLAKPPHLGSWLFYPPMQMDRRLLNVDAVFVSHQHQDHFDIDFLRMLGGQVPIYIVSGRPQFEGQLKKAGVDFTVVPTEVRFDLGGDVTCIGINHEYNGIDAAVALSNGKFTVYHGNDCFVSNERLACIVEAYPKIDVACVPFAYVHWYPFLMEEVDSGWKASEAQRLISRYLDYGLEQIALLKPDVAIPFGANMFYADDIDSDHNKAVVSPFDFKDYAERVDFIYKDNIFALFAGDMVFAKFSDVLRVTQAAFTKEQLFAGFSEFLDRVRDEGTGFDERAFETLTFEQIADFSFIRNRIEEVRLYEPHNIYVSNTRRPDWDFVQIDLSSGEVFRVNMIDDTVPFHHFRLTDVAYKAYFSQAFTFNEIVASSRFRLVRVPNEYNLDVLKVVNNSL